jgi:hypothetical protein
MQQYTSVLSRALQWDRVEAGPCKRTWIVAFWAFDGRADHSEVEHAAVC